MSWTEEKNARRCDLIDKEIDSVLTASEMAELNTLQSEMLEYRRRVAPLTLWLKKRRTGSKERSRTQEP
jgi:hypothetical protein